MFVNVFDCLPHSGTYIRWKGSIKVSTIKEQFKLSYFSVFSTISPILRLLAVYSSINQFVTKTYWNSLINNYSKFEYIPTAM